MTPYRIIAMEYIISEIDTKGVSSRGVNVKSSTMIEVWTQSNPGYGTTPKNKYFQIYSNGINH